MTSGAWSLTAALRATGLLTPTDQPTGAPVILTDGVDQVLTYGTGSGQCDIIVWRLKTLNATTAATYDLYAGTDLKDLYDDAAAFRKVKSLVVWVDSGGDASGVRVGGAGSDIWPAFFANSSDMHLVFPSGPPYLGGSPAGVAVGAATKNLKVENLGAVAAVVGIAVAGTSA
jgi:hypothetical protein